VNTRPRDGGLPGDQAEAQQRRAERRRRWFNGALTLAVLAVLVVLVGPTSARPELPPLGPAVHDLVALRAFTDEEPAVDLAASQERAVAAVPVQYSFDDKAAERRIAAIHDAFNAVRPRWRLYLAERERLAATGSDAAALQQLDASIDAELGKLRPEFEANLVARRSELSAEVFAALRKAGFAEEVELVLTDTAKVVLDQRILRDRERFEDDLQRGVWDLTAQQPMAAKTTTGKTTAEGLLDLEAAQRKAEAYVDESLRQRGSSRWEEPGLQGAVRTLARGVVDVTFGRDVQATRAAEDKARASVPRTRVVRIAAGESLVKRGDLVTPAVRDRVARMLQGLGDDGLLPRSYAATALTLALAVLLFAGFASRHLHHFRHRPRDAHLLMAILVAHALVLRGSIALGQVVLQPGAPVTPLLWALALPYALGPTLATLFLKPFTAMPFSLLCTVVASVMLHNTRLLHETPGLEGVLTVEALVLGLAGVHAARHFRQRADLISGAATISGVGMACAAIVGLFSAPAGADLITADSGWLLAAGGAGGVLCYLLLSALTPVFETAFNRLTDIKLLELTSMNHPALRLLATEAPGTFTHSVMVGNLAEAGCDAIGANGLLARVGAYYHDLGKTKNPKYFAENQSGENPHDRLKPHLSALIIRSHVKDGIKLLKSFGLPDEIIDFVPQHHGTSLIAHFYHRAQRDQTEGEELNEADFRYPGPKPQRRETALLMLADAVEAACKALPEPNPLRVQAVVRKIIAGKMEDGQFEECDLTLRELALVEQALVRTVLGMQHSRPVYLPPLGAQPGAQQPLPLHGRADAAPLGPTLVKTGEHSRPDSDTTSGARSQRAS
jgi:putative nucleotidyltransferase with HDIG domain